MMMKKSFLHTALATSAFLLAACDSGDIEEKIYTAEDTGQVVKVTATISGLGDWDDDYNVALAGFNDNSNFAVMQRTLPHSIEDGTPVELILNNVTENISTVEFAITDKLRGRVITLSSVAMADYSESKDTIRMNLGTLDVSMFGVLQTGMFNVACIQCHGGNGRSAAGLNLTDGMSYDQLVDVPSSRIEGSYRVVSGEPEQSVMRMILHEGGEDILHYNHTEVLSSQFKTNLDEVQNLIDEWIKKLQ